MAQLAKTSHPAFKGLDKLRFDQRMAREQEIFDEMQQKAAALPEGKLEGAIVKFPYADGYALYMVQKEKPLILQHIPYGDAWHIPDSHIRGLRHADVAGMVASDRRITEMFAAKKRNG